jgi:hypothetical protein
VLKGLTTKDQHFLSCNFCSCDVGKINYSWLPEYKNSDDNTTFKSSPAVGEFLAFKFDPTHNTTIIYFLIGKLDFPSYTISYWKFSFIIILTFIVNLWSKTNSPSFAANFHLKFFECESVKCVDSTWIVARWKKLLNLPTKKTQIQVSFLGQSGS